MADALILEFKAKTDDLEKRLKAIEKSVADTGKASKKVTADMGAQFKNLGTQIATAFGVTMGVASFVSVMRGAFNAAKDFEAQMSKVRAISGATAAEMQKLSESAQRLGASTMFTATQVGQLQEEYARLGFSTKEILSATSATLDLAAATGESLATAAQVAGATVRGFGLDASETVRVTDVMAVSFSKSALNMSDFAEGMKLVAPIARAANIPIETTTALLGKLADAGLRGSLAGTALKNLISKLADENSDLSKELGFSVKNTDDLFRAFKQLQTGNIDLTKATELTDERSKAAFLTLINGVDSAEKLTVALNDVTGATAEMARIMQDNFAGDVIKASSAWEGFMLQIMKTDSARETVQSFTLAVNGMSRAIRNLGGETNEMIAVIESFDKFAAGFAEGASEYIRRYVKTLEDGGDNTRAFAKAQEQLVYNQGLLTAKEKERLALNENLEKAQKRLESLPFLAKQTREVKANIEALKLKILENERDAGGLAAAIAVYERYIEVLNGAKKGTEELSEASVRSMNRLNAELKVIKDQLQNAEIGSIAFLKALVAAQAKIKEISEANDIELRFTLDDEDFSAQDSAIRRELQADYDKYKALQKQREDHNAYLDKATKDELAAEFEKINAIEQAEKDARDRQREADEEANAIAVQLTQEVLSSIGSIYSSVNQMAQQSADFEMAMYRQKFEEGLITREELAAKERKLQAESAQRAKDAATFNAVIGAAQAAINALASPGVPFPVALAFSLLAAATAGIQVAAIQSASVPQFAKGVIDLKGEGTETSDSIHAKLSRGESVMTAKETRQHRPILEAIRKGTLERMIAETYVRPAVDAAMLSGFADMGRSAELNGLTANLKDHNIIAATDRLRSATVYGLKMLADEIKANKRRGDRNTWH